MHFIWPTQDNYEKNQASQIPHAFQIWCLTPHFLAMLVHRGAERFGANWGTPPSSHRAAWSESPAEPQSSFRSRFQAASRR